MPPTPYSFSTPTNHKKIWIISRNQVAHGSQDFKKVKFQVISRFSRSYFPKIPGYFNAATEIFLHHGWRKFWNLTIWNAPDWLDFTPFPSNITSPWLKKILKFDHLKCSDWVDFTPFPCRKMIFAGKRTKSQVIPRFSRFSRSWLKSQVIPRFSRFSRVLGTM